MENTSTIPVTVIWQVYSFLNSNPYKILLDESSFIRSDQEIQSNCFLVMKNDSKFV